MRPTTVTSVAILVMDNAFIVLHADLICVLIAIKLHKLLVSMVPENVEVWSCAYVHRN